MPEADRIGPAWAEPEAARARFVAAWLDAAAAVHPGAPVVGLWADSAPELGLRTESDGPSRTWLIDASPARLARAAAAHPSARIVTRRATLADLCAGYVRVDGCAAIYVPTLAAHLPPAPLLALCDVLLDWLRPGGRLLVMLASPMSSADVRLVRHGLVRHAVVHVALEAGGTTPPHLVLAPRGATERSFAT